MKRSGMRAALSIMACLCLAACLGKAPPVEEYLRLGMAPGDCANHVAAEGYVLAMKPVSALDNLNRQAVLMGRGRVLTPSLRWYWEASPEDLVGEALAAKIACLDGFAGAAPYRSRLSHDAGIAGTLTAFNLQEDGGARFALSMRLELWSEDYKRLLASTVIDCAQPVATMDAQGVAEAATKAVNEACAKAGDWLESARQAIAAAKKEREASAN